ncbi:DUF6232 family protein [Planktothrix agardhii 1029]|jgi:hypothetical protein|nr:DUF6232 family protein [Planktothrix agardhii]MCB8764311.1 DUF6232 family protein [Planktothrix agardhii 1809]MCB8777962.1 DUF6232 family protein [Planktothrix agardhii 1031]MCB8782365.1 DUF6232 family protein [Planktothrix agardhii 1808]MCF3566604.1 DUF6232 family protein [Planktothrix agardhii 1807]MCF3589785.1 DUF6232 family protein [Planktothrix agardhii 1029]
MDFFNNGSVVVTRNTFQVPGTQYPIRNIGAVKTLTVKPDRNWPIICFIVGFFLIAVYGLGLLIIGLGIYWWISQKTKYCIIVVSSGTESQAYSSSNMNEIKEIQSAINSALAEH